MDVWKNWIPENVFGCFVCFVWYIVILSVCSRFGVISCIYEHILKYVFAIVRKIWKSYKWGSEIHGRVFPEENKKLGRQKLPQRGLTNIICFHHNAQIEIPNPPAQVSKLKFPSQSFQAKVPKLKFSSWSSQAKSCKPKTPYGSWQNSKLASRWHHGSSYPLDQV